MIRKSKLVREIQQNPDRIMYIPTLPEAKRLFHIINREVFNSVLEIPKMEIRRRRGAWGECIIYDLRGEFYSLISFNHKMLSKKHFISVVAHEMIHHWEGTFLKVDPSHGPTFWQWKPKLAKFNIKLEVNQDHQ